VPEGELHVFGERIERHPLQFPSGQSLGAAELADLPSWRAAHPEFSSDATSCAAVLRFLHQVQIAYRHCVFVPAAQLDDTLRRLASHAEKAEVTFTAAIAVSGCTAANSTAAESGWMFLIDQRQWGVVAAAGKPTEWLLPTGQVVRASIAGGAGESAGFPKPYLVSDLASRSLRLAPSHWQLYPINEMSADIYEREPAYTCYLHPDHKSLFRRHWLLFENEALQEIHHGVSLQLASKPVFTRQVPPSRVGLHESLAKGLGVRPGEAVKIQATSVRLPLFESRVFRYRHAVCRVTYASAVDIGHPVARLRSPLLDVLGLNPGQEIVITALAEGRGERRHLKRVRVRSLAAYEDDSDSIEVANVQAAIGVEDIEPIALDLLRRQALSVRPGSPVVIRPALLSLLGQEVVPVSLAFTTAIISGVAVSNPTLVTIVAVCFIGLIVALLLRKFR
jgi:hypothetical protein